MKIIKTGDIYGKLTVIKYVKTIKNRKHYECICECGNTVLVNRSSLKNGTTRSCGCLRGKKRDIDVIQEAIDEPYGKSRTVLYGVWTGIKNRCLNPNNYSYYKYGGRGITVCDQWIEYDNFKIWALKNGYNNNLTIDRIDNNGNYEPSNCRWVDMKVQSNNTRRNVRVKYKGMNKTISQWAEYFGINYSNLTAAHCLGKPYDEVIKYYYKKHIENKA